MSAIQEYWLKHHTADEHFGRFHTQCRRLICADGYNVSVQASEFHYCSPRTYMPDGAYSAWELGFPTAHDELLDNYAEEPGNPTETVYGWVPTEIVDALIARHGGLSARSNRGEEDNG